MRFGTRSSPFLSLKNRTCSGYVGPKIYVARGTMTKMICFRYTTTTFWLLFLAYFPACNFPNLSIRSDCLRRNFPHKRLPANNQNRRKNNFVWCKSQTNKRRGTGRQNHTSKGPFFWWSAVTFWQNSLKRPSTSPTTKLRREPRNPYHISPYCHGKTVFSRGDGIFSPG